MKNSELILMNKIENASESDIDRIDKKIDDMNRGKLSGVWNIVEALFKMIKDPKAAWTSKAVAIGTLLYVISPLDAIPDFIPFAGLTDDVGLVLFTFKKLAEDLVVYMEINKVKSSALAYDRAVEIEKLHIAHDEKMQRARRTNALMIAGIIFLGIFCIAVVIYNK